MDRKTIIDRLLHRFGAGNDPKRRRALYERIATLVELHGDAAYRLLCEVAAESASATKPDRYFCTSIVRRFSERGICPTSL